MSSRPETEMTQKDPARQRGIRLAYFSPLPPAPTGIADYSRELLPHLATLAEVTVFVPDDADNPTERELPVEFRPVSEFGPRRREFDLPLYQMGNSSQHEFVYQQALRYPGVVVLHEFFLHHLLATLSGSDEMYGAYVRDLGYALGTPGVDMAWQIRYGLRPYPLFSLPLSDRLIDRSLGVLVHSQTVATWLVNRDGQRPVGVVPQLMTPREGRSMRDRLPSELGVTPETVIFASMGQVTAGKRLDLALRSFARLLTRYPESRYLIVGQVAADYDLVGLIQELGLAEVVHCTGYVAALDTFGDWCATADIIVNLRQPTLGETSAAVLRAMAAGRPTIVFDHGWYGELPEETCLQIPVQDEHALFEAMLSLVGNPDRRGEIGDRAVDYVKNKLAPDACAKQYLSFLETLLRNLNETYLRSIDE